jgi:hypothetical protein
MRPLRARENRQFPDVCAGCGSDDTHWRNSLRAVRLTIARGGKVVARTSCRGATVIRRQLLAHFGTEIVAAAHRSAYTNGIRD